MVDANPILSALLSERSAASRIFWSAKIREFATTAFTVGEVEKYLPELAKKLHRPEEELRLNLRLLPLTVYEREAYKGHGKEAEEQIGERDPDDVDLLALALHLGAPIWSNDKDFEEAEVIRPASRKGSAW